MRRLAVLMVLAVTAGAAGAADPAHDEMDKQAKKVAFDVVALGADLFNAGNPEGCYRLYQGALMALQPMVAHRADLAKTIQDRIARANALRNPPDRAFALREALDAVIAGKGVGQPAKAQTTKPGTKPLWDRLGGEAGVRKVAQDFLTAAAKDPKANIDRNGNYPLTKERAERVVQLVVEFLSSVTGGPLKYTGRDMKNTHQGMKITEEEFNLAAKYLVEALKKNGVAQAEIDELVGLVGSVKNDIVEVKK